MNVETHVSVPASSANLGAGFDVFGLAIDLRDEYLFRSADRDIIEATGKFSSHVPRDTKRNLAFRAFKSLAPAGTGRYRLKAQREIPPVGGLGGSAAAIVGGLVAANRAFELGYDNNELLRRATEIEGHPDNVAAALTASFRSSVATYRSVPANSTLMSMFPSPLGQYGYRRQHLALEKLQKRAAAGRDIADVITDVEFLDRGQRVAAAGDRKRITGGDGV